MKIISHFHGCLRNDYIVLKPVDNKDRFIIEKLFKNKSDREIRHQQEVLLRCEISAPYQNKTFKQNNAVWILVGIIFQSLENRNGTAEELYDVYSSLLEEYAQKVPSRLTGKLRTLHLSEMNTVQAGRFIDSILYHIATYCDLNYDQQTDVRKFIYEWEEWKNKKENEYVEFDTIAEMREKVVFSEASGKTPVHFHHIVSRGACPMAIDKTWNILALTPDEHNFFHQQCKSYDEFLEVFPHLKGKIEKAYRKVAELNRGKNE